MRAFHILIIGAFLVPFLVVDHYRRGGQRAVAASATAAAKPKLPIGVSDVLYAISVPSHAAQTPERVRLGEKLFLDKRLSADDSTSCSTCHDPDKGFTDQKPRAEGIRKQVGKRNSPTVLNAMFNASQFWDGRAASLEEQAKLPILNPVEMGMRSPTEVVAKLKGLPEYPAEFQRVFGRDIQYDDLAAAIAAFERTKFSGNAPFDRFVHGEEGAINAAAKRGWALFNGKGRCNDCHAGNIVAPLFSDQKFHNIGIAARSANFVALAREAVRVVRSGDQKQIDELALQTKFSELGRFMVTKNENEVGAFKTPTLRNIGITGPYMHDGSLKTLWDVMDHYNKGGEPNPFLDGGMQRLGLTESQIDDLVAFMFTLTDERFRELAQREQKRQFGLKGQRPQRDTAAATGKKGDLGDLAPEPDPKEKSPADLGVFGPSLEGAER
jgi:cytochrome c peroxidase